MKESRLMSITEHSDWLEEQYNSSITKWNLHRERLEFGKQPLSIEMFVPCKFVDGVWVVLEEPFKLHNGEKVDDSYPEEVLEYLQAKNNCLFEIYSFEGEAENFWYFGIDELTLIGAEKNGTIEDLVKYNLTLTKAI